jgi:predicted nucleic acid-binding protein
MSKACLDNTFVSDYLDGEQYTEDYLIKKMGEAKIYVPQIVRFEATVRVFLSDHGTTMQDIQNNLNGFRNAPLDRESVNEAAKIRGELLDDESKSKIDSPDALIAGIARAMDATLITSNTDDFDDVSGLEIKNPRDD